MSDVPDRVARSAAGHGFDRSGIPVPVLESAPELVDLYWVAWELAWQHVVERDGAPQSPYMDEGFDPETVWIWDTAFMSHFCKYAPDRFPGVESFDNFYRVMFEGASSPLKIQHPDNPPLLAWSELEYVQHTGDLDRVRRILAAGYLQGHFAFFDSTPPGSRFAWSRVPTALQRTPRGYRWDGVASGMDNTPRAAQQAEHGTVGNILWFDAAAQQALNALSIARLAELIDDATTAATYHARHLELVALVQDYWDPQDRFFHDRHDEDPHDFHRVRTPAAYWPLLAETADAEQAAALADALIDPATFGGPVPWPSVARADPAFRPTGQYWRGGVWVPMAYVSARALADAGYQRHATEATFRLLRHMSQTYLEYEPATIWEAYATDRPAPSTGKDDRYIVRPDFCGWSALAPIAMLIEHVLGFRVDALTATVGWRRPAGVSGITGLRCGTISLDLLAGAADTVEITTTAAVRVDIDGTVIHIPPGSTTLSVLRPTRTAASSAG